MGPFAQEPLLDAIDELLVASLEEWQQLYGLFTEHISYGTDQTTLDLLHSTLQQGSLTQQHYLQNHPGSVLLYGGASADTAPCALLLYNSFSLPHPNAWELIPIITQVIALDLYRKLCTKYPPIPYKWLLQGCEKNRNSTLGLGDGIALYGNALRANGCLADATQALREIGLTNGYTPLLALGSKGLLRVQLSVQTGRHPLPAQHGSLAPDAAWRLLWALNSLKNVQEEILIEGFYDALKAPEDDVIALLRSLPDNAQHLNHQLGIDHLLYNLQGFQLHYARYLLPTCTISSLMSQDETAPHSYPHIPALCSAELDFHLLPDQIPQDIFSLLRRHLDAQGFSDVQINMLYACPAYSTSLADSFTQSVLQASSKACDRQPYILPFTPESHPFHQLRHTLHMPVVITAMNPCDITGPIMQNEQLRQIVATAIKQTILTLTNLAS